MANKPPPLSPNGHSPPPPCGVGGWVGAWSLELSFSIFLVTLPVATIRLKSRMWISSRTCSKHYEQGRTVLNFLKTTWHQILNISTELQQKQAGQGRITTCLKSRLWVLWRACTKHNDYPKFPKTTITSNIQYSKGLVANARAPGATFASWPVACTTSATKKAWTMPPTPRRRRCCPRNRP